MKLTLIRQLFGDTCTEGELLIDGAHFCFTLELPVKDGLPGSAIPQGIYPVTAHLSPRFGRTMPIINDIPERSEILIHWGNTAEDTNGCLLVGLKREKEFIGESRNAFDALWQKTANSLLAGTLIIQVMGGLPTNHDTVQAAAAGEN